MSRFPLKGTPIQSEFERRIADILATLIPAQDIYKESTLKELGCDSLKTIQFLHKLKKEFKIKSIDINTLRNHSFIHSLATYLEQTQ